MESSGQWFRVLVFSNRLGSGAWLCTSWAAASGKSAWPSPPAATANGSGLGVIGTCRDLAQTSLAGTKRTYGLLYVVFFL